MADYVTTEQVAAITHEFDALNVTGSDLLLTASSRLFEKQTGVPDDFYAAAASPASYATREFIGDGTAYLKLDPYTALNPTDPITLNDDTVADPSFSTANVPDYVARNGSLVVLDRTVRRRYSPYTLDRFTGWPDGKQIRVSANWGFTSIPADVTIACAHIFVALWRTADPAFAVISNAEGAATRIETIPKIARDIIAEYKARYNKTPLFV